MEVFGGMARQTEAHAHAAKGPFLPPATARGVVLCSAWPCRVIAPWVYTSIVWRVLRCTKGTARAKVGQVPATPPSASPLESRTHSGGTRRVKCNLSLRVWPFAWARRGYHAVRGWGASIADAAGHLSGAKVLWKFQEQAESGQTRPRMSFAQLGRTIIRRCHQG